jgi:hypothetical protein
MVRDTILAAETVKSETINYVQSEKRRRKFKDFTTYQITTTTYKSRVSRRIGIGRKGRRGVRKRPSICVKYVNIKRKPSKSLIEKQTYEDED